MTVEAVVAATGPGLGVSFAAGALSFLSPCVAPLVPAYLSYIGGVSGEQTEVTSHRRLLVTTGNSLLFVLGFTTVFVFLGTGASMLGIFAQEQKRLLAQISGGFMIFMGLLMAGLVRFPWLHQERRLHFDGRALGPAGPVLVGMAFAGGWTPCIGPVLASILLYATSVEAGGQGGILLLAYSVGLGVPFLLAGALWTQGLHFTRWFRRYYGVVNLASGALLVTMGVLLLANRWFYISIWAQRLAAKLT